MDAIRILWTMAARQVVFKRNMDARYGASYRVFKERGTMQFREAS